MSSVALTGAKPEPALARARSIDLAKLITIAVPSIFFTTFFLGPLIYLVLLGFWRVDNFKIVAEYSLANYADIARNFLAGSNYGYSILQTLYVAGTTAVLAVLVCYPMALAIVYAVPPSRQRLILLLAVAPFWTSYILRVYAWQVLLARKGVINSALASMGIDQIRVDFLYTQLATRVGLVHYLAPILLVILYVAINNVDRSLIEAARQMGASRLQVLLRVILPLTRTGITLCLSFSALVACGDVLSGSILGGGAGQSLIGKLPLFADMILRAYLSSTNLPHTAALALVLIVVMLVILAASFIATERTRIDVK